MIDIIEKYLMIDGCMLLAFCLMYGVDVIFSLWAMWVRARYSTVTCLSFNWSGVLHSFFLGSSPLRLDRYSSSSVVVNCGR